MQKTCLFSVAKYHFENNFYMTIYNLSLQQDKLFTMDAQDEEALDMLKKKLEVCKKAIEVIDEQEMPY